jgi:hypothetical protein
MELARGSKANDRWASGNGWQTAASSKLGTLGKLELSLVAKDPSFFTSDLNGLGTRGLAVGEHRSITGTDITAGFGVLGLKPV